MILIFKGGGGEEIIFKILQFVFSKIYYNLLYSLPQNMTLSAPLVAFSFL